MDVSIYHWIGFNAIILTLLIADLKGFHKEEHIITLREALIGSAFWILLALGFGYWIYAHEGGGQNGRDYAMQYLAGFVIEKSLSVDNLFVFIMIFAYFRVSPKIQHKILFYGIIGALVFRAIFIFAGAELLHHFEWTKYIFGGFLLFTALKLMFQSDHKVDPGQNPMVKLFRKFMPMDTNPDPHTFFSRINGKLHATILFLVLIVVETTDVLFAVDSVPAVLAVSRDKFVVYTSNVFALLGLRSLYFALAGLLPLFRFLQYGLSLILAFVGVKMLLPKEMSIPPHITLPIILGILAACVILSLVIKKKPGESSGKTGH